MSERTNEKLSLCHAHGNTYKKVGRNGCRKSHCGRSAFLGNVKHTTEFQEFCYQILSLPESHRDQEQTDAHSP